MAGSTRAELASTSLDGTSFAPAYSSGQRGSYSSSNLERSGSFRDGLEGRMMVSGPIVSRNAAGISVEVPLVSQYMSLEPISLNEPKNRSGELRRVLGISVEDHSFGCLQSKPPPPISWEELKRFKASVEETSSRAKDRKSLLLDSLSKLDRFRNIVSRKRQRSDILSNEKSTNSNLLKIGSQAHQSPCDLASQRPEERTKNGVPNKRVRTSMVEVRASLSYSLPEGRNVLTVRQGPMFDKDKGIHSDKDKNMLRACNGVPMPSEEKMRGLPAGGDWDKKMKRKRSVGTLVNKTSTDTDRELKQAAQQRPNSEQRSRSGDGFGFRAGSSNGLVGNIKMDGPSPVSGGAPRTVPRNEVGNGSLSNDRRERSSGADKERNTVKGSNKMNICEDTQLGSQSPLTKGKAARAPRTSSGVVMNPPNLPRSSGSIDGSEQPSCLNKVQLMTGGNNRKRPLPTESSSPPVARWGGQRREKTSRTRRANVVSPVSNFDESQAEGFVAPDIGASGALFNRAVQNNINVKLKLENVSSPAVPSESEESAAPENKSKDKGFGNGEVEDGTLNGVQKTATFLLPTKKNKAPPREEIGDGVRRQGRTGRGSIQSKACLQLNKERLETLETAKPLKSGRLVSDKAESRVGRPPSKKASDRRVSNRSQLINSGTSDLTGESDDDHEELLAIARDVRNASCLAKSGKFWIQMEPIFSSVGPEDLALLKDQINFAELEGSFCNTPDAGNGVMAEDTSQAVSHHVSGQVDDVQSVKSTRRKVETDRWFKQAIPLSQRLLSAFISEEVTADNSFKQEDASAQFSSDFLPHSTSCFTENRRGPNPTNVCLDFDNDVGSQTNYCEDDRHCDGFASPSTNFRSPSNFISGDELLRENDIVNPDDPDSRSFSEFDQDRLNQRESTATDPSGASPRETQFEQMSLDEKILLELHSIGVYPDAVPDVADGDDNEIDKAISELRCRLYEQTKKKKIQFCKLEKVILETKDYEMRKLERLAMDKLVETAFRKLQGGRGNGSSHKSGASKIAKQLAVAFAKRTIARCQKYEETGQSCFNEPILRHLLFSSPVHEKASKTVDAISSMVPLDVPAESHSFQIGSQVPAAGVSSDTIERHGPISKLEKSQLDQYQGFTDFSEKTLVRNDSISNRGKKREVLLDDVGSGAASRAFPPTNSPVQGGAKWRKIDKDHNRDTKHSAPKGSRPSLATGRGERKTKTKPKQKIAQLSTTGNGLGRVTETTDMLPSMRESCEALQTGSTKPTTEVEVAASKHSAQNLSKTMDDNIFRNLPLQGLDSIDELDVADGLDGQGQDIGSWLNVDDDAFQDNDLVGLEIPMDDLSELKLNF